MLKIILVLCCFFGGIAPSLVMASNEKPTIKTAVAEGFGDGLHAKYLHYLAQKLSVNISLTTMPFARRVIQMRTGELDMMVGLQRTENRDDDFVYISPHYESLSYRIFALKDNVEDIAQYEDLHGKYIGVNQWAKYFHRFDNDKDLKKYELNNLEQKIRMLQHGRIDAFIHYQESTWPTLKRLEAEHLIAKTVYQPEHSNKHYVVISKSSPLMARIPELEAIIEQAIANNDFLKIRLKHYADNS